MMLSIADGPLFVHASKNAAIKILTPDKSLVFVGVVPEGPEERFLAVQTDVAV